MTTSAKHRERVLQTLLKHGALCEMDIRCLTGVSGAWLAYALVGLLHQDAVRFLGRMPGRRGVPAFMWEAIPTRPGFSDPKPDGAPEHGLTDSTAGRYDETPRPVPDPPSPREKNTGRKDEQND